MQLKIGSKKIGEGQPCFIIAEAGSNHNHSLPTAKKLIEAASSAGADAVKFQAINFGQLYLPEFLPDKTPTKLFPKIELPEKWYQELAGHAQKKKILFLCSPTYFKAVDLLEKVGVKAYKIASPQTSGFLPLVSYIAQRKKPIFLSTGYCSLLEIKKAVDVCFKAGNRKLVILRCAANYPAKPEQANLNAISFLARKFRLLTGFSDHTLGFNITLAAVVKGAKVIEKHFTLNKKMKGPDHFFSLEPQEFQEMVRQVRQVEAALGEEGLAQISLREKRLLPSLKMRLITKNQMAKGVRLERDGLHFKRASCGILANDLAKIIGRSLKRSLKANQPLSWSDVC